ncbi:hypothetical protein EVAR_22257_1 [Eumeta japonica]|uniref:Uncharacterized protein n=1 Tax=Eumeta variegata TaxID=151549 RepID=A0A4C1UAQ8_EUMVA|nr:hypothetical protein EVAR_22257_1 [Eumeta japonica]
MVNIQRAFREFNRRDEGALVAAHRIRRRAGNPLNNAAARRRAAAAGDLELAGGSPRPLTSHRMIEEKTEQQEAREIGHSSYTRQKRCWTPYARLGSAQRGSVALPEAAVARKILLKHICLHAYCRGSIASDGCPSFNGK